MDSPAPSPHAEYDRWIARRERWGAWWRRFGQIAFYVVGGILAIAFAALLVASLIDLGQPRIWGTFTQTGCEESRRGCRPYGTWVSDDRTIVLHDVDLDGGTDGTGTVRASYQPTALLGDDIVHVPLFSGTMPLFLGGLLIGWVGYILYKAASFGDIPLPPSALAGSVDPGLDGDRARSASEDPSDASTGSRSNAARATHQRTARRRKRRSDPLESGADLMKIGGHAEEKTARPA